MHYINVRLVDYDVYEEISLVFEKTDIPTLTDPKRQVLLKVRGTALNRSEINLKRKFAAILEEYSDTEDGSPMPSLPILGNEAVGYVVDPKTFEILEQKFVGGVLESGGYGQYVVMDRSSLIRFPENLTLEQCASIPNSWVAAYHILEFDGKPKKGNIVYVSAGASGVGVALIQLLKKKYGVLVIASCGSESKAEALRGLGADLVINYKEDGLSSAGIIERVNVFTGGKGVDLVLDCVGPKDVEIYQQILGFESTWVIYGELGGVGMEGSSTIFKEILEKKIKIIGSSLNKKARRKKLIERFNQMIMPGFRDGVYRAVVYKSFQIDFENKDSEAEVNEAHRVIESNENIGKVVILNKN
jgi:NADPH:quinone reductase-like Zn-dependent oxidoreductase